MTAPTCKECLSGGVCMDSPCFDLHCGHCVEFRRAQHIYSSEEIQNGYSWINDRDVQCDKCRAIFNPDNGFESIEEHYIKHMKSKECKK